MQCDFLFPTPVWHDDIKLDVDSLISFAVPLMNPNPMEYGSYESGYINAATVDGVAPFAGLKWSGGSAPSAGGSSGRDVYTFTIFKDGSATNSYEIFGAVTNYA